MEWKERRVRRIWHWKDTVLEEVEKFYLEAARYKRITLTIEYDTPIEKNNKHVLQIVDRKELEIAKKGGIDMEWYEDWEKRMEVAELLVEEGELKTINDIFYFMEKPWKWNKEYEELKKQGKIL